MNKYNIYVGANEYRRTDLTRKQVIEGYRRLEKLPDVAGKHITIYCSTRDFYVKQPSYKNSFFGHFFDLSSEIGRLMYDENAILLENSERGLKFRHNDKICFVKNNKIEYVENKTE